MPKVSVWLTSYNHGQFIRESIESILGQTYTDYEFYIVDDCSTDNSWDIIQEYAALDTRIKPIRHSCNQGDSGLHLMLDELDGDFVAIAHCDDAWTPNKLEKQVKILEGNSDIAACFTLVNLIDDNGNCFTDERHPYARVFEQPNRTRYEWLEYFFYNGNCLCHPSILIRRKAYADFGLVTKGISGLPDFCMWIRLCKKREIYVLQEHLTKFRVHTDGSNTSGENAKSIYRYSTEEWLILKEYEALIDAKEVTKVFPEAKKYIVNGEICEKYALAQIMLNHDKNSYRLYGLQLLYELLQEQESEQEIFRLYGYTRRTYNVDKQKYDIFSVIPQHRYMRMSIYLNNNGSYNENDKITTTVFVQQTGNFTIQVDLKKIPVEMLSRLRIDLDEGRYRKFKIYKCLCDDKCLDMVPINGKRQGEWELFYTFDPQYEISLEHNGQLYIEGYTEEISCSDVEQYFNSLQYCFRGLQQQYNKLNEEITRMKDTKMWRMRTKILHLLGK